VAAILAAGGWFLSTKPVASPVAAGLNLPPAARGIASTSTSLGAPASASASSITLQLQEVKACYASSSCSFPQTDPRSYEFAVGRRLAALLESLRKSGASAEELEAAAQEFMLVDDGFVQEEAIKIFSSLPPSRASVEAMTKGLELSHSPLLIEQAMNEWERYIGSPEEAVIQEFLAAFIARGGQFSSEKASSLVLRFLNERSEAAFRAALATMVPESTAAKNLRAALDEYERKTSGG